jgi:outer membrane lipoprotein-sorting protein
MMRMRGIVVGGMFAVMLLSTSANCFAAARGQEGFTLQQLMKALAQRKHGQVSYEETDCLAVLDRPLKSSGVLIYDAPGHLEKRTLKPKQQSLILDGDELTVHRGRRTYRMQVSAYPQLAPLVDAMRDTLAGNEDALERVFKVGFTGTAEDWKLELVPLDKKMARKVRGVEIAGAHDEIRSVEILQVGGDRSVMTLGKPGDAAEGGP